MKWGYDILVFTVLSFLAGCKKEGAGSLPPASINPTSYALVSEVWSGPVTNGQSQFLFYDSLHLLTDYKIISWSQGSQADTGSFHLEYSNRRISRLDEFTPFSLLYSTYEYNGKGALEKITSFTNDEPYAMAVYAYNNMGQATDERIYYTYAASTKIDAHYIFVYDAAGNLSTEIDSSFEMQPASVTIYVYTNYDDKVNYLRTVNGGPMTFTSDFNSSYSFAQGSSVSPNNYGRVSIFGMNQPGDTIGLSGTIDYAYQYNDAGLPVQMTTGPWIVTFQYQKY